MSTFNSYNKKPFVSVACGHVSAWAGWDAIGKCLREALRKASHRPAIVAVDCYTGVMDEEVMAELHHAIKPDLVIQTGSLMKPASEIESMVAPYLGNDPVFGRMTYLEMQDYFDTRKLSAAQDLMRSRTDGVVLIYGPGAALLAARPEILIYVDMARWEIQRRFRQRAISNLGCNNAGVSSAAQYKQGYFVDWRVCDKHKFRLFDAVDFFLDTNTPHSPKLVLGDALRAAMRQVARQPFRVVPFFDPAPWGGQWMKDTFSLDPGEANYGWGFDCVPEENSLHLKFGDVMTEFPAINVVYRQPRELLGDSVYARFGPEFPIRFDLLDTVGGGNLSFQVHPLTGYIQQHFGMHYTQDESYYILDAAPDASVYLGLRNGINPADMAADLYKAQQGKAPFPADVYANRWPAQRHDHFLIPAGTCHCSGAGGLVLEISATPYIFTFKLWDWGRNGLDGAPRPVHLEHGLANLQWDRTREWTQRHLINRLTALGSGPGWREERTGLHEMEFIETRRHWFTDDVPHHTGGGVNVLNLVQGDAVTVESPTGEFDPVIIHYAETFIVPASVGAYTIRPLNSSGSQKYATIKAFVRPVMAQIGPAINIPLDNVPNARSGTDKSAHNNHEVFVGFKKI
ncbi:MAG: class I mannose-6-phosphate isomerase [Phycisphaerae bacterium]